MSAVPGGQVPLVTPELAGIGGEIKRRPEDFAVEELALYEPCGQGEHVYVRIRRSGWNTLDLASALAALFGLPPRAMGFAGHKDKQAIATQTFSLHLCEGHAGHEGDPGAIAERIRSALPVEVLSAARHTNKLRAGHLAGNRFSVVVADVHADALARARRIAAAVEDRGLPNAFGPQRFGSDGRNAERGRALLEDARRPRKPLERLWLSAWQSERFNAWLALRIARGTFDRLLDGDVAKKTSTGGLFEVRDPAAETERLARRELVCTGPIYGARMLAAARAAGEIEREVLEASGIAPAALAVIALPGSRRPAQVFPAGLAIAADPRGLRIDFELPKGAYATVLLAEFVKGDAPRVDDPPEEP